MIVILILLISSNIVQVLTKEWIDPHDMNTNSKLNLIKSSTGDVGNTKIMRKSCDYENLEEKTTLVYLKRFVNLILNSAVSDGADMKLRSGKYDFNTDSENYKFLSEFTSDQNINVESLRKLDTILSNVFRRHISDDVFDSLLTFQEKVFYLVFNIKSAMILAVLLCLYIGHKLLISEYTFWYIFRYFLMIIFIVDYGYRYSLLYEEAENHNLKIEYSPKCDPITMGWGDYFVFLMKKEDCERKYVTPLEVALFQLKHIIIIPMSALGTGFGQFANQLWVALPWPWNFIIFPIMLVFVTILWIISTTTVKGIPLKIKLMHLFHLELGKQNDDTNRVTGSTLDQLLNVIGVHHRPMVENTNSSPDKRKKIKDKRKSPSSKSQGTLEGNNLKDTRKSPPGKSQGTLEGHNLKDKRKSPPGKSQGTLEGNDLKNINTSSHTDETKRKDRSPSKSEKINLNRTNESDKENTAVVIQK